VYNNAIHYKTSKLHFSIVYSKVAKHALYLACLLRTLGKGVATENPIEGLHATKLEVKGYNTK